MATRKVKRLWMFNRTVPKGRKVVSRRREPTVQEFPSHSLKSPEGAKASDFRVSPLRGSRISLLIQKTIPAHLPNKHNKHRQHGWLMIEVLVTIWILVMLTGALTAVTLTAGKGNRQLWARQQALYAVEAQLDCLTHAAAPLPAEEFERLWPGFVSAIEFAPGTGPNEGLEYATVTVTGRVSKKDIRVTGQRYIPRRDQ